MITGSTISDRLKKQRRTLENAVDKAAETARGLDLRIERSQQEEAALWNEFAIIQLGAGRAIPEGLEGRKGAVSKLQKLIDERNAAVAEAHRLEDEYRGDKAKLVAVRDARARVFTEARTDFDARYAKFEAALAANPRHVALMTERGGLDQSRTGLMDKLSRAESEAKEKGKAYENDELFSYLHGRGYGTDGYHATGIVRTLDRWVSDITGYRDAAAEYGRLKSIPEWVSARLGDLEDKIKACDAEINEIGAEMKAELEPFFRKTQDAESALVSAEADLRRLKDRREAAANLLVNVADGTDAAQKKIVEAFVSLLVDEKENALRLMAERTSTSRDDELLRRMKQLEHERLRVSSDVARVRSGMAEDKQRLDKVRSVERNLKQKGWESSNHEFSLSRTDTLIQQLLIGQITANDLWRHIESNYHRDTAARHDVGGYSSGGSIWGSSTSGSRSSSSDDSWSSGGGFGGGSSWSSGGGFGGSDSSSSGGGFGGD